MTSTQTTARRLFYVRRVVHVAIQGAENALCGVRLVGAIDTEFPASCENCAAHAFETHPRLWAQVQPVGEDITEVGGLPESTAGF